MSVIRAKNLTKIYKIYKREKGLLGSVQGLFKRKFEYITAVNDISFEVEEGEIVGYIGPNGAGKSTTIKMLSGILVPTAGCITVHGINPCQERAKNARKMGAVFGQRTQLWWDIPVRDSIELNRYMYNIPEKRFKRNLALFDEILDLHTFIDIPVRQLSLGQRMRADLCMTVLHDPDILYLDEPTIGLDVSVKKRIRDFILEINRTRKVTVILTTHDISDIEKLCTRVLVIDKGIIVFDGHLNELKQKYGKFRRIIFDLKDNDIEKVIPHLAIGIISISREQNKLCVDYDKTLINSSVIIKTVLDFCRVEDIVFIENDIEDIVRHFYEDSR